VFGTADDGLALKYYGPTQDDLSPCIDAGDSTLPGLPDTDIIGNEREIGDAVDMGAYEAMPTFAHWKLDGNANDSSGNGRNGALNGTTTEDDGIFGDALEFDGIDDYVEITDNSFDSITDAITLSAWITADVLDISTQETIIAKDTAWKLYRNATTETICFTCTADSTESVTGAVKINDGLWHHVVGVYDGSDLYLYIDGVEDGTPPNASGTITNFDDVYIGSEDDNPSESWEGLIDDVRVYDYALDARQVKILFEEASYWRFVAFGDSRAYSYYGVNAVILGEIADAIVAEKAEFVVFPGDLVAGDTTASGQEQLEYWKGVMAPVYNEGIKVMPLRGNHEIRPGIDENDWKTVFSAEIPDNGPPVEVDLTYYLKHRNAIFIALDQYVGDIENHQINQTWLNSVLADNTWSVVGDDARQHVFVAAHEPAFMVQHDGCMHRKPEERNEFWGTLEEELGCRTYFCGHDHFYDHAWIDDEDSGTNDVEQFVVGTAGAELREWYKDWVDPTEPYKGINSNWTPKRQAYSGVELGVYCFGYVVAEVWGESNVRTHWKRRINKTTSAPSGYEPGNDVFGYSVPEDTDAPVINSVTALDENTVVVVFNEWVEETSAEDIGNYKIDEDEPDVANAELDASNPKKVTLTTENLTAGVQYTLEVDNVKDRSSGQNAVAKKTKVFKLYEEVTLIDEEDSSWNYRKGMSEPPSNWKDVDFEEDGSWLQGQTSIGYGGYSNNTVLSDMQNTYSTIYLRHTFDIATAGDMPDYIQVKVYIDDGCIVYINGNEVDRFHAGPGVKYHNSLSDNWHSAEWETTDWLDASNYSLQVGTNIMAIHALNYTLNSSDLSIDAQLLVKR